MSLIPSIYALLQRANTWTKEQLFPDGVGVAGASDLLRFKGGGNTILAGSFNNGLAISAPLPGIATINVLNGYEKNSNPLPIQEGYESPEFAFAGGSLITVAHGLGHKPENFEVFLRCITAEYGYAVGDEVKPESMSISGTTYGLTLFADNTNVYVKVGATGIPIIRKNNAIAAVVTNTNWRMVLKYYD